MEGLKSKTITVGDLSITLHERSCRNRKCTNKFYSSEKKQKFCSSLCAGVEQPFVSVPNYIKNFDERGYRTAEEAINAEDSD